MAKASDFSKRLKAIHLGGVARDLTVRQVGVEKQQKRNKQEVTIFASDGSADNEAQTENVVYIWFKELPITRNMRVNETNLTAMIEALGEDFRAWIGAKVTLTPQEIFAFGKRQQTIVITKITPAPKQPAAQKPANAQQQKIDVGNIGEGVKIPSAQPA